MLFKAKNICMTCGVKAMVDNEELSMTVIQELLYKHFNNDGSECKSDNRENAKAIKSNYGRVVSVFNVNNEKLWIITDGLGCDHPDYPLTTVLLPEEY